MNMVNEAPTSRTLIAKSEAQTSAIASRVARVLPPGTIVVLTGPLGVGKTRFVKAFAAACGVAEDDVVSPTFVLCRHYNGTQPITHLDVYRLGDIEEFLSLGPEDLYASQGVTFIEWGERVAEVLPVNQLHLRMAVDLDGTRELRFESAEPELAEVIARI